MNYREYKKYIDDNQLIESPEAIQCLADAIQLNKNIKTIKSMNEDELALYGSFNLNPHELIADFEERKNSLIRMAINLCYSKEKAFESFGKVYQFQVKEMIKNTNPRIASITPLDIDK